MVDSTIIRAHQHAGGLETGKQEQELKEGFRANYMLLVMHLAIYVRFFVTAGQRSALDMIKEQEYGGTCCG